MSNPTYLCQTCELGKTARRPRWLKPVVMYVVMVAVSTTAIVLLEHATFANAIRTAMVAAIGKTVAANWVSGIFE